MKDGKINDMDNFSKVQLENILEIKRHDDNWYETAKIVDSLGLRGMGELCTIDN